MTSAEANTASTIAPCPFLAKKVIDLRVLTSADRVVDRQDDHVLTSADRVVDRQDDHKIDFFSLYWYIQSGTSIYSAILA